MDRATLEVGEPDKLKAQTGRSRLKVGFSWLFGCAVASALLFWPGGILLLTVAMWGGFSPGVSVVWKTTVLMAAVLAIAGTFYFLARLIAKGVQRAF